MVPGKGVSCQLEGKQVIAGNKKLLREAGVVVEETVSAEADTWVSRGCTVIYTAINGELAGYLVFSDTVRKESQPGDYRTAEKSWNKIGASDRRPRKCSSGHCRPAGYSGSTCRVPAGR